MTRFAPFCLVLLTGCSSVGTPLNWPFGPASGTGSTAAYNQQRGQVELIVKSGFDAVLADIGAGGGPVLTQAMDAAGVPQTDRPARILQMQGDYGLYSANPGALVTALMLFGS